MSADNHDNHDASAPDNREYHDTPFAELDEDTRRLALKAANNHAHFDSFIWHSDKPDDAELWCIWETSHRDSDSVQRANARVIADTMREYGDDVFEWSANHWAVGHVDGHVVRVFRYNNEPQWDDEYIDRLRRLMTIDPTLLRRKCEHGEHWHWREYTGDCRIVTGAALAMFALVESMDEYPVLDDEVLSAVESEDEDESWRAWGEREFAEYCALEYAREFVAYRERDGAIVSIDPTNDKDESLIAIRDEIFEALHDCGDTPLRKRYDDAVGEAMHDCSIGPWTHDSGGPSLECASIFEQMSDYAELFDVDDSCRVPITRASGIVTPCGAAAIGYVYDDGEPPVVLATRVYGVCTRCLARLGGR